jgi:hypothetical protein
MRLIKPPFIKKSIALLMVLSERLRILAISDIVIEGSFLTNSKIARQLGDGSSHLRNPLSNG